MPQVARSPFRCYIPATISVWCCAIESTRLREQNFVDVGDNTIGVNVDDVNRLGVRKFPGIDTRELFAAVAIASGRRRSRERCTNRKLTASVECLRFDLADIDASWQLQRQNFVLPPVQLGLQAELCGDGEHSALHERGRVDAGGGGRPTPPTTPRRSATPSYSGSTWSFRPQRGVAKSLTHRSTQQRRVTGDRQQSCSMATLRAVATATATALLSTCGAQRRSAWTLKLWSTPLETTLHAARSTGCPF